MHLSTTLELMDDIVEEALRHVSPAVREHDLKVVPCDEPALVNVDARLMVQLVVNLVNNAITYTPAGSHIVISIGVDDGRVACPMTARALRPRTASESLSRSTPPTTVLPTAIAAWAWVFRSAAPLR